MTLSVIVILATALATWIFSRRFTMMVLVLAIAWGATVHGVIQVKLPDAVVARIEAHEAKQEKERALFLCERHSLAAIQGDDHERFDQVQRNCTVTAPVDDDADRDVASR
ncbi:MAG: hypothetical protein Q7T55_01320 [Solirubrobacteraceae bacterium]|nr:hypothetical protein [Solirubrobacteraceae bacterium]